MAWSSDYHHVFTKQEYEQVFSSPSPLDYSGYCSWDFNFQPEFGMQETILDTVPVGDQMFQNDPFYSPIDLSQKHNLIISEFFFCDTGDALGGCNYETMSGFENDEAPEQQKFIMDVEKKVVKRSKEQVKSSSNTKKLARETVSQYFYMPITQAAKELNVGLTLLKKRCRELGIRRWPHRKLMSLQTLIKNVQEFGEEGESHDLKESVEILKQEKKMMEEIPDMQLEDKTKRLRQAFFKANYKKRKLIGIVDSCSKSTSHHHNSAKADENPVNFCGSREGGDDDIVDVDEEFKYFFSDCFSSDSSGIMF